MNEQQKTKLQKLLDKLYKDLYYIDSKQNNIQSLSAELSNINSMSEFLKCKKKRGLDIRKGYLIHKEAERPVIDLHLASIQNIHFKLIPLISLESY